MKSRFLIFILSTCIGVISCNPFGDSKFDGQHLEKEKYVEPVIETLQLVLKQSTVVQGLASEFSVVYKAGDQESDVTSKVELSFSNNKASKATGNFLATSEVGSVVVKAKYLELTSSAILSIQTPEVIGLNLTSSADSVNTSETLQVRAADVYNNGVNIEISTGINWSSSDTSIATVNSSGLVTGVLQGNVVISATTAKGKVGSINLVVNPYRPTFVASNRLWLDASDMSSLYQDHTQITPVTASGQTVGTWRDLSGNNYHMTQSTLADRPTYLVNQTSTNLPCISFGSADTLFITNLLGLSTGDPRTFITVGKINNTANAREPFINQSLPGSIADYISFDTRSATNPYFGIYLPFTHIESNYLLDTLLHIFRFTILDSTIGNPLGLNTNIIYKIDSTMTNLAAILGGRISEVMQL